MTLKLSASEVFVIVVFFGLVGVLLAVALLAVALSIVPARGDEPQCPYSCRLLDDDEQKNCAFGNCDNDEVAEIILRQHLSLSLDKVITIWAAFGRDLDISPRLHSLKNKQRNGFCFQ